MKRPLLAAVVLTSLAAAIGFSYKWPLWSTPKEEPVAIAQPAVENAIKSPSHSLPANDTPAAIPPPAEVPPAIDTPPAMDAPGNPVPQHARPQPTGGQTAVAVDAVPVSVSEPEAREALNLVGADEVANKIWYTAINDPNLDPKDRKNLIEDLNENGFADPKNLTADDLPLIESRLAMIDEIGNDAMDDVNYAAFEEAYKDLLDMRAKLVGQ